MNYNIRATLMTRKRHASPSVNIVGKRKLNRNLADDIANKVLFPEFDFIEYYSFLVSFLGRR